MLKNLVASFMILLYLIASCTYLMAQGETEKLQSRIEVLEQENKNLKRRLVMLEFAIDKELGVERIIKVDGKIAAKLYIYEEGWGDSHPNDVAAVCVSVAETVCRVIRPDADRIPTVMIMYGEIGPISLTKRGPNGEYYVILESKDRRWAQLAYQFSHELGHVLCGDLSLKEPQAWFEEAFCEALSLWTLDEMGKSWKTKPPYNNWKSYAPYITEYIEDVRKKADKPQSIKNWYGLHRNYLNKNRYDRAKNLIVAIKLAEMFHQDNGHLKSFYFMRRKGKHTSVDTLDWLLDDWQVNAPERYKSTPQVISKMLGVTP